MATLTAAPTRDAGSGIAGGPGMPSLRPDGSPRSQRKAPKSIEPEQFDAIEGAVLAISNEPFWAFTRYFPRNADIDGMRGRKPASPDYVKALFFTLKWQTRSLGAAVRLMQKPQNWFMLRAALQMHLPDGYDDVPLDPPSLSQAKSFMAKYGHLEDEFLSLMEGEQTELWTAVAQTFGLLDPNAPRSTRSPDLDQSITMDGTIMRPAYGHGPDDSVGPQIKFNDENAVNKEIGSKIVATLTRVKDTPGARFLLRMDMVPPGVNGGPGGEAPVAERAAFAINEASGGAVQALIIDSVIRGAANCRLAHAGIALVSYPHAKANKNRAKQGRFAEHRQEKSLEVATLHAIKPRNGKAACACTAPLLFVGGNPMTRGRDDTGREILVPLEVLNIQHRADKGGHRWYYELRVPCKHGGFRASHRLFPEKQGIDASLGEVVRVFPVASEQFQNLSGRRNDTESWHNQLKRDRDRMPARGMKAQRLYLIGLQILENSKTLERLRDRNGPPSTLDIVRGMLAERLAA